MHMNKSKCSSSKNYFFVAFLFYFSIRQHNSEYIFFVGLLLQLLAVSLLLLLLLLYLIANANKEFYNKTIKNYKFIFI